MASNCTGYSTYATNSKDGQWKYPPPMESNQMSCKMIPNVTDSSVDDGEAADGKDGKVQHVWTYAAVVLLLNTFRDHKHMFGSPLIKKQDFWMKIAATMSPRVCHVTSELCEKKWNNMKTRYKTIKKQILSTGNGRVLWPYYKIMEELLTQDPSGQVSSANAPPITCENIWTDQAVISLLEAFRDNKNMFLSPLTMKKDVWMKIANDMFLRGYPFSHEMCEKKWSNMKKRYRVIRDKIATTGHRVPWPYYKLMEELMVDDPTSVPSSNAPQNTLSSSYPDVNKPRKEAKKRKADGQQPPEWFTEYTKKSLDLQKQVLQAIKERNDLLKKLTEKL